jgi:hypothetical protein
MLVGFPRLGVAMAMSEAMNGSKLPVYPDGPNRPAGRDLPGCVPSWSGRRASFASGASLPLDGGFTAEEVLAAEGQKSRIGNKSADIAGPLSSASCCHIHAWLAAPLPLWKLGFAIADRIGYGRATRTVAAWPPACEATWCAFPSV